MTTEKGPDFSGPFRLVAPGRNFTWTNGFTVSIELRVA